MDIDENAPGNRSQQSVTRTTDNEPGHEPRHDEPEVPLPPDDDSPLDEAMPDVDANNSVSSEYPQAGTRGRDEDTDGAQGVNRPEAGAKDPGAAPASDPESGA